MSSLLPKSFLHAAISILVASAYLGADLRGQGTDLAAGFQSPPDSAAPGTWWQWMNGNVTKAGITADLEAMHRVGIRRATIIVIGWDIPPGPARYLSPEWFDLFRFAVSEASRVGIRLGFGNCAGWSSSGGPWVTPENSMQMVVHTETTVTGPTHFSSALPQPTTNEHYYRELRVVAFPTPADAAARISDFRRKADFDQPPHAPGTPPPSSPAAATDADAIPLGQLVDVSSHLDANGVLTWDVPAGHWTILRFGYTTNTTRNHPAPPEGTGLECDKLSRQAVQKFWEGGPARIVAAAGPAAGTVFNHVLIDSYEVGMQNWSPVMAGEFTRLRGYDPLPYLPVLTGRVVGSLDQSERFLWDFRRTIADLYTENYYDEMADLAHASKLDLNVEPYGGGPLDNSMSGRHADRIMGEFWWNNAKLEDFDMVCVRIATSAAHTYGEPIVGAESFTSGDGGWDMSPPTLKALGDDAFASGVNLFTFHRYAMQPWLNRVPGMTMGPFGSNLDRTNTWWEESGPWMRYLARSQYLLQQGLSVTDILEFNQEGAPSSAASLGKPQLPDGYVYDACSPDALINRASVRDGRIVFPDGMSYRVLMLPGGGKMAPQLLQKVKELADGGATILGNKPTHSPSLSGYPLADQAVSRMADALWSSGKVSTKSLSQALADLGVKPDFQMEGAPRGVIETHRIVGDTDIYFVSNQTGLPQEVACTFRVQGKVPELWHADTGMIEKEPVYAEHDGSTSLPLRLDPIESVFIVFRGKAESGRVHPVAISNEATREKPQTLDITSATYGLLDGGPTTDVTQHLASLVREGMISVDVTNLLCSGSDPAPGKKKALHVEYRVDGVEKSDTVPENGEFSVMPKRPDFPAVTCREDGKGAFLLEASTAGTYQVGLSDGSRKSVVVPDPGTPVAVEGPWTLDFPVGWKAPPSLQLDTLGSWTDQADPGVKYFSGTATYRRNLQVPSGLLGPGRHLYLDLGDVQVIARVKLNGRDLGILWKPPYRVDITPAARTGDNALEVAVTNLWPNRIIGDDQLPNDGQNDNGGGIGRWPQWLLDGKPSPTGRVTFATYRHWKKDSPLFPSGLLGPVALRPTLTVPLPETVAQ